MTSTVARPARRFTTELAALSLLQPSPEQTDLLRAGLWSGSPASEAWARWRRAAGDVRTAIERDHSGIKSLLPVLDAGLRGSGAAADPAARTAIGAAALAERLRWDAYGSVADRAFAALTAASIPFLVLKGPALAVSVYPHPALRHSHDIDLLLRARDLQRAAGVLSPAGFSRTTARRGTAPETIALVDGSQLPLELHARLYRLPYYESPPAVWDRASTFCLGSADRQTLSPEDHLVYVCGQAACCASRDSLKWVVDAFYLVTTGLDWERVLAAARESRLALPLAVIAGYLSRDLEVPVPPFVLAGLAESASRADRVALEVALTGLRAGRRGTFRNVFRETPTWRGRLDVGRWMIMPSPGAVRLGEPLRWPRAWPAYYVARPLSYLGRRLRGAIAAARRPRKGGGPG